MKTELESYVRQKWDTIPLLVAVTHMRQSGKETQLDKTRRRLMKSIKYQEGTQSAHELRDDQNNTGSLNTDVETKTKLERSK